MLNLDNIFVFLDTAQLGNMYFGKPEETPMKATLKVRNDDTVKIDELKIHINVVDIRTKQNLFNKEFALKNLDCGETLDCDVDFSQIKIYGTFDVIITLKGETASTVSQTKIARVPVAERQDDFLAINTHIAAGQDEGQDIGIDLVKKAGCGWIMEDMLWCQCEHEKGVFNIPNEHKKFAKKCENAGLKIRFNMDARGPQAFYAEGSHPVKDVQIEQFARYCTEVAKQFKGLGCAYEICSEWDHQCKAQKSETENSPEAYAKLLQASYKAIKAVDPDSLVLHAGTCRCNKKWMKRMLEAGGAGYTDALVIHPYPYHLFQISPAYTCTQTWMSILDMFNEYEKLSDKYCGGIPVWNTESGWSTCTEFVNGCTEILQAAYTLQMYIVSKCNKLMKKLNFYVLSDCGKDLANFEHMIGLVGTPGKNDESDVPYLVKPAFCVLPVAVNLLWDIEFVKSFELNDYLAIYQFRNSQGKYVTTFFTMEGVCCELSVGTDVFTENDIAYDMYSNVMKPVIKGEKVVFPASDYPIMLFSDKPIEDFEIGNMQNMKDIPENITDLFAIL